jgi:hypothetical protein
MSRPICIRFCRNGELFAVQFLLAAATTPQAEGGSEHKELLVTIAAPCLTLLYFFEDV